MSTHKLNPSFSPPLLSIAFATSTRFLILEHKPRPGWLNRRGVPQGACFTRVHGHKHEKKKKNCSKKTSPFSLEMINKRLSSACWNKVPENTDTTKQVQKATVYFSLTFSFSWQSDFQISLKLWLQHLSKSPVIKQHDVWREPWSLVARLVLDVKLWGLCEQEKENRRWNLAGA